MAHRTQDEVIDTLENLLEDVMNKCEYSRLNLNNQEQFLNVHTCGPTRSASLSEEISSRSLALVPYISREDWFSRLWLPTTMIPTTNCRTNLSTSARIVRRPKIIANRRTNTYMLVSDSEDESAQSKNNVGSPVAPNMVNNEPILPASSESSESDLDDEVSEVYEVCSARAVRVRGLILKQFLIKWSGYSSKTWVDEVDLSCPEKLREFYARRGSSIVEPIAGATNSQDEFNLDNWVTSGDVLRIIKGWKNAKAYKSNLSFAVFDGLKSHNSIYLMEHNCHFYVIMHYFDSKKIYISDGGNIYQNNRSVRRQIKT